MRAPRWRRPRLRRGDLARGRPREPREREERLSSGRRRRPALLAGAGLRDVSPDESSREIASRGDLARGHLAGGDPLSRGARRERRRGSLDDGGGDRGPAGSLRRASSGGAADARRRPPASRGRLLRPLPCPWCPPPRTRHRPRDPKTARRLRARPPASSFFEFGRVLASRGSGRESSPTRRCAEGASGPCSRPRAGRAFASTQPSGGRARSAGAERPPWSWFSGGRADLLSFAVPRFGPAVFVFCWWALPLAMCALGHSSRSSQKGVEMTSKSLFFRLSTTRRKMKARCRQKTEAWNPLQPKNSKAKRHSPHRGVIFLVSLSSCAPWSFVFVDFVVAQMTSRESKKPTIR